MSRQFSSVALPKNIRPWLFGLAVSTPVISILQGALLLIDYRTNHGNAPHPETPSRGIVIVEGSKTQPTSSITQGLVNSLLRRHTTKLNNEPPLRILVLGDSLAAGVGMSKSSTPALPESIAQGLSQAMGGRAVYWTCIGSPGSTSLEVVSQILDLDDLRTPLIAKILEWQDETRIRAEVTRRAAKEWWEIHKEPVVVDEQEVTHPFGRWWKRFSAGFQRDVKNLKKVIVPVESHDDRDERRREELNKRVTRMLRRQSLRPAFLGQYDIAVILCGLNDLKDTFLPFLTPRRKDPYKEASNTEHEDNIKSRLVNIVQALQSRMNIIGARVEEAEQCLVNDSSDDNEMDSTRGGDPPMIVFPALPIEPTILSHLVPLSWFLVPLVHAMDRNKKNLAELYPDLVLFVESPGRQVFSDAQQRQGSIWEELRSEKIILKLSDVGNNVQNKIKGLMDEHYKSLATDQGYDYLYQLDLDGIALVDDLDSLAPVGAALLASDGIHPNDLGYEVWGRFIARKIIERLETDRRLLSAGCRMVTITKQ
ncbi:hypothetical protein MPSEU_000682900 [Mayamaea pseudoterrestris]|nr:hypothetical protein MPSEU_000682900 [Mayamaea pseudoterrestris]